jgi:hypothetical protein
MNIDYSICEALKYNTEGMQQALLCYDVICEWAVNFGRRVKQSSFLDAPTMELIFGIGKFHLNAHKDDCFPKFSPNFIRGAGQLDGEQMETLWAIIDLISPITKYMTKAHRREILDDMMRHSNWKKLVGMSKQHPASFPWFDIHCLNSKNVDSKT